MIFGSKRSVDRPRKNVLDEFFDEIIVIPSAIVALAVLFAMMEANAATEKFRAVVEDADDLEEDES